MGYWKRRYRPERLVISATGKVDHDRLVAQLSEYEALTAAQTREPRSRALSPSKGPNGTAGRSIRWCLTRSRRFEQSTAVLATPGPGLFDDDRFPIGLLSIIVGGGMASRLFVEVRERRGLAYGIEAGETSYSDAGLWSVDWQCAPDRVAEILTLVRQCLADLAEHGVTAEELARAKGQLAGQTVLSFEGPQSRMSRLGTAELHGDPRSVADLLVAYDATTAEDVRRVAADLLAQRQVLAVVGPSTALRPLRRALPARPRCRAAHGPGRRDLLRALVTGYEIQVALVKAISLHAHKIDHVAHLGPTCRRRPGNAARPVDRDDLSGDRPGAAHDDRDPAVPQGGDLDLEGVRAGVRGQARRRGGRSGDARPDQPEPDLRGRGRGDRLAAGRAGGELSRRAARAGRAAAGDPATPTPRNTPRSIRTRPSSISLAVWATSAQLRDPAQVASIILHTSHHTHNVIGSGSERSAEVSIRPPAGRPLITRSRTSSPSLSQDCAWHHVTSYYARPRARPETVELWQRVTTAEDADWTRRYHSPEPAEKAFGGRVEIELTTARS